MAISVAPEDWIPDITSDGTDITIPIASIPGLLDTEADPTTGDIREVLRTLLDLIANDWYDLVTADTPAGIAISRSGPNSSRTGGVMTTTYQITFQTTITDQAMIPAS